MGSHDHGFTPATARHRRALAVALGATVLTAATGVVGAATTGSLALLADAGHVLADAGGLVLTLGAGVLAARSPSGRRTFGWARAEVLAAAVNGLVLCCLGVYVVVEGVRRLVDPVAVAPLAMALFAAVGLVGNAVGIVALYRARHAGLAMRGAFLEVAADGLTSLGVLVAAGVVAATGWTRADAVASVAIGAWIVPRAVRVLRGAVEVLLELAPSDLDLDGVRRHLLDVDHVREVHDLHVHSVTSGLPVLTAHLVVDAECFRDGHAPELLDRVQSCLSGHFDVAHSTIQLEPVGHASHEHPVHA